MYIASTEYPSNNSASMVAARPRPPGSARVLTGKRVDERVVMSLVDDDQLVLPARRRNEVPGERGEDDVPARVLHWVLEHVDASDVGQLPEQTVQLVLKAGGDRIGIDVQMNVGGRDRRVREREAVEDVESKLLRVEASCDALVM